MADEKTPTTSEADEKTPTTSEAEDVEAHLLRDRSGSERPEMDASSEEPEVEGHLLSGSRPGEL